LVPRGPINLITNNFKIKSQNQGIIYTYSVDFIEGESATMQDQPKSDPSEDTSNPEAQGQEPTTADEVTQQLASMQLGDEERKEEPEH